MNNTNLDKEKKNKTFMVVSILILIITMFGVTYALFQLIAPTGYLAGQAECYTVNYTKGQDISGELTMGTDYTSGWSTDIVMYSSPSCASMMGNLYITTNESSTMDLSDGALKYTVLTGGTVISEGTVNGTTNQIIYNDFNLNTTSTTYTVYIWLDSNLEDNSMGENEAYSGFIHADAVLLSDIDTASLATLVQLKLTDSIKNEELTTFTTTSKLDGTTGIYKSEDDLGISYYFRGNVTNNYVKFGKYTEDAYQAYNRNTGTTTYASTCTSGANITCTKIASADDDMYWRIIRINGDGTIRLIYDGTSAFANGDDSKDVDNNSIGYSAYNTSYNDNAYVGYMYGTTGSTTYEATHANTNNSTLKSTIEAWYAKYLDTNYSTYIADAIYCNDRTRVTDTVINQMLGATGEGFGTYVTGYSLYDRIAISVEDMSISATPTLKCGQQNDRFTKNATVGNVLGNAKLTYPVGTITIDEVVFAGGNLYLDETSINNESYLYAGYYYWSLSPAVFFGGDYAYAFRVSDGSIIDYDVTYGSRAARPAITLNSNAITGGLGTQTQPFVVSS